MKMFLRTYNAIEVFFFCVGTLVFRHRQCNALGNVSTYSHVQRHEFFPEVARCGIRHPVTSVIKYNERYIQRISRHQEAIQLQHGTGANERQTLSRYRA
jgi:hypothetical protein